MHAIVSKVMEVSGIKELNPVQQLAVENGLFGDQNMVVAAPTASGKTLIAEMAALKAVSEGRKVVYIVPLKALASEKFEEFREKYEPLGIKTAISVGDLDSNDPWLERYDIIITTSEKMDSLLRHGIDWAGQIGLVVVDEIHLLNDADRGPTLEIVLTRLKEVISPRILGLSATISNYEELAEWLKAKAVRSDYRPVKLYSGICHKKKVFLYPDIKKTLDSEDSLKELILDSIQKGKQSLVFISTRKNAEAAAEKMAGHIGEKLMTNEKRYLSGLSEKITDALEQPTRQCKKLSECMKSGVAFHHAGLVAKQRSIVEKAFREGMIKAIFATPTLAAGINMPAWRVIIRDLKRYSGWGGMDYLPVLEVWQMAGRAGRPKYDADGEAILMARDKAEAIFAWQNYILGEPEKITSRLGVEPILRMHALGLIANHVTMKKSHLHSFMNKTFYAHHYKDTALLGEKIEKVLDMLKDMGFIIIGDRNEKNGDFVIASDMNKDAKLEATRIGKRVAELYIDPVSAHWLLRCLKSERINGLDDFGLLHIICRCRELKPLLGVYRKDSAYINDIVLSEEGSFIEMPNEFDIEYDDFLRAVKTASMLKRWSGEASEESLLEDYNVTPGELRAKLDISDWLLYSMQELALILGSGHISKIRKLRIRLKYGIREELLPLVKLKGIGRIRSRMLFNSGFRSIDSLRKAPLESIERVLGGKLAESVKEQLGGMKEEKDGIEDFIEKSGRVE
ncbi:MAG: DEAD/DEAH box helicase [Candidatus Aenigmarchaeota archaeon]|nr:DEAD/DEAH box helicase [Candidatus Aenigmarchaeota archaeon]